jgi:hypothetical protein
VNGLVRAIAEHYSPHTVPGVWLCVLTFIAGIVAIALGVRFAFPIKSTPLHQQVSETVDLVSKEA